MKKLVILLMCAAFLSACQKKPVAVVNGEQIPEKVFERILNEKVSDHAAKGAHADTTALRHAVLEQVVIEKLMVQAAKAKNITVSDEEINAEIEAMKKSQGADKFGEDLRKGSLSLDDYKNIVRERQTAIKFMNSLVSDASITEDEIKDFYKSSPTPFLKPETVNVRFIQVSTAEQAMEIMKELNEKKTDFDKLADRLSAEGKAMVSGYGWTSPGFFSPAFTAALKELKPGQFGGPYQGKDGYYVLKVKEKQKEGVKSLDEARAEIKAQLLDQKRQAAIASWASSSRNTATIVIN